VAVLSLRRRCEASLTRNNPPHGLSLNPVVMPRRGQHSGDQIHITASCIPEWPVGGSGEPRSEASRKSPRHVSKVRVCDRCWLIVARANVSEDCGCTKRCNMQRNGSKIEGGGSDAPRGIGRNISHGRVAAPRRRSRLEKNPTQLAPIRPGAPNATGYRAGNSFADPPYD
jgi:hypothetical protein